MLKHLRPRHRTSGGNNPLCFALFDRQQNIRNEPALWFRAEIAFAVQTNGNVAGPAMAGSRPPMTSMVWIFAFPASAIFAPARDLSGLMGSVPKSVLPWTNLASLVSE
jgi:hypothetical protein